MKQQGFSLIEVMVSITILAISLLGLGALQAKALPLAQSSHYRSIAADLAADLASRIRANRTPYLAKENNRAPENFPLPPDFSACTQDAKAPASVSCGEKAEKYHAVADMHEWTQTLVAQLPEGRYTLVQTAATDSVFYRYTLTITWNDDRMKNQNANYITVIE